LLFLVIISLTSVMRLQEFCTVEGASRLIKVFSRSDEQGNPLGPARVWLRYQDVPGLAMSRSLGDGVASSVGVICDPETLEFTMTHDDKFIVIGSDGVFEFISNEEVVKIVVPYWRVNDSEGAAEAIVREAQNRWNAVRFI
jgi:serine/threonine protein phosphatase PrpC